MQTCSIAQLHDSTEGENLLCRSDLFAVSELGNHHNRYLADIDYLGNEDLKCFYKNRATNIRRNQTIRRREHFYFVNGKVFSLVTKFIVQDLCLIIAIIIYRFEGFSKD